MMMSIGRLAVNSSLVLTERRDEDEDGMWEWVSNVSLCHLSPCDLLL
jgi:limonene-1,2-epoxide hydrolase